MTISVQDVISRVRRILVDEGVRWTDSELLQWLGDAQRIIVLQKPDANAVTADVAALAGTRQTLPSGAFQLLDVVKGPTGRAVRPTTRAALDAENPLWHTAAQSNVTRHYVYDAKTPDVFWVYPPATAGTLLTIIYSAPPPQPTIAGNIGLGDVYIGVIVDYILYRAFMKDADYAQNAPRADKHYEQFMAALAAKNANEETMGA